jgi:hypothetical protein
MKKFTKISAIALAGIFVLSSVAACSSVSRAKSADNMNAKSTLSGRSSGAEYEAVREDVNAAMGDAGYNDEYDAVASEDSQANPNVNANQTNPELTSGVPTSAMLIKRVNMNVETTEFNNVKSAVEAKIVELGGYIESSNVSGTGKNGNLHYATLVIRVPVDKLDALVNMVGTSATVLSSNESAEDVTLQYSDIQAKIKSLKVEQDTLMGLLAQADSLDSILVLQNRLTEVRYEIESYESRGRVLANQAAYSTLTLNINEVVEITEQIETKKPTFGEEVWEGLQNSLETLKEGGKDFTIGFVAALPFLLVIGLFALIVFIIVMACVKGGRRKRAKRAAKLAEQKAAAEAKPVVEEAPAAPAEKTAEEPAETKDEEKK